MYPTTILQVVIAYETSSKDIVCITYEDWSLCVISAKVPIIADKIGSIYSCIWRFIQSVQKVFRGGEGYISFFHVYLSFFLHHLYVCISVLSIYSWLFTIYFLSFFSFLFSSLFLALTLTFSRSICTLGCPKQNSVSRGKWWVRLL